MKKIIILCYAALSSIVAVAQRKDFTGRWNRVDSLCIVGEGITINSIPILYQIEQSDSSLVINRTSKNTEGQVTTYTENLSFNGSPSETTLPNGLVKHSALTWAKDSISFITTAEFRDASGNIKHSGKNTWKYANDGQSFTVISDISADGRSYHWVAIFEKQ